MIAVHATRELFSCGPPKSKGETCKEGGREREIRRDDAPRLSLYLQVRMEYGEAKAVLDTGYIEREGLRKGKHGQTHVIDWRNFTL